MTNREQNLSIKKITVLFTELTGGLNFGTNWAESPKKEGLET